MEVVNSTRSRWFVLLRSCLILIATAGLISSARAGNVVVSSLDIPLRTGGDVASFVRVVTQVTLPPTSDAPAFINVHAVLPASASVVDPDGRPIVITGGSHHASVHDISDGEIIPCVMPGFRLIRTGEGESPTAFDMLLELQFSESGELIGGTATPQFVR